MTDLRSLTGAAGSGGGGEGSGAGSAAGRCRACGRRTASRRARSASPRPPGRRPPPGGPAARANGGDADRARADRRVPVAGRAAGVQRVVGVHQAEPAGADGGDQRVEGRGHPARHGEVVPGRPGVAGVEADAEPRVAVQRGEVGPEVLDRGGQRPARRPRVGSTSSRGPSVAAARRAAAAAARAAGAARRRSGPRRPRSRRARPPRGSRARRRGRRACASVAIDCSTVASVGEPTLTRQRRVDEGRARRARRSRRRNAASWRGSPARERPAARVADEDLDGARRRPRRCRRGRPASPPLSWMCAPIGGSCGPVEQVTRISTVDADGRRPVARLGRLPAHAVAEERGGLDLQARPASRISVGLVLGALAGHVGHRHLGHARRDTVIVTVLPKGLAPAAGAGATP